MKIYAKPVIIFAIICFCLLSVNISSCAMAKSPLTKKEQSWGFKSANKIPESTPEMFREYLNNMQQKIKKNWNPPKSYVKTRVVLQYKINRQGKIFDYKIISSSNNKKMDNAAIKALKKSAPFEPLPEAFDKDFIEVQFTFDYKIHNTRKY